MPLKCKDSELKKIFDYYRTKHYKEDKSLKDNLCKVIFAICGYKGATHLDKCNLLTKIPEFDRDVASFFHNDQLEYLMWLDRYLSYGYLIKTTKFKPRYIFKRNIKLLQNQRKWKRVS